MLFGLAACQAQKRSTTVFSQLLIPLYRENTVYTTEEHGWLCSKFICFFFWLVFIFLTFAVEMNVLQSRLSETLMVIACLRWILLS